MNEFNIALYIGASYKTITLKAYINMSEDERANMNVDFNHISFSLMIDGKELLSHLISLGPLTMMLPQFDQAISLLSQGKSALLRSGVLDVSEGHYVYFSSIPDSEFVLISLISIAKLPMGEYFPQGYNSEKLYEYVLRNYKPLIEKNRKDGYPTEIKFNRKELIANLELNKELGALIHYT